MKQTDLMLQSKTTLIGLIGLCMATSCTFEQPTYFNEAELLTDSVITTDAEGHILSRTTFCHDEAGRDTLAKTTSGGHVTSLSTTYTPDGDKMAETFRTDAYTVFTTYAKTNDTLTLVSMTARTADGTEAGETTELTTDSAGRVTQSLTTTADDKQKKVKTLRNARGQETQVTTWQRDTVTAEWEPLSQLTYEYADTLPQRAAYATWDADKWTELSYETYAYDAAGRLIKKEEHADDVCVTTTRTYDKAGNPKSQQVRQTDSDGQKSTISGELNWEYGELVKTEVEYSVVETYNGKSRIEETRRTTYYSPKSTAPQMAETGH